MKWILLLIANICAGLIAAFIWARLTTHGINDSDLVSMFKTPIHTNIGTLFAYTIVFLVAFLVQTRIYAARKQRSVNVERDAERIKRNQLYDRILFLIRIRTDLQAGNIIKRLLSDQGNTVSEVDITVALNDLLHNGVIFMNIVEEGYALNWNYKWKLNRLKAKTVTL
jgi:ABC-type multidrug transport system fused ATPase/permease subunit